MDTTYTLLPNGMVRKGADTFIPDDPGNRDRQEYEAWLDDGGKPELEDELEIVQPRLSELDDLTCRITALEAVVASLIGKR